MRYLTILLFIIATRAWGFDCYSPQGRALTDTIDFSKISIDTSAPVGSVIWQSEWITKQVECDTLNVGTGGRGMIFINFFPYGSLSPIPGTEIRVFYGGSSFSRRSRAFTNVSIDFPHASITMDVDFYVYLVKTGDIPLDVVNSDWIELFYVGNDTFSQSSKYALYATGFVGLRCSVKILNDKEIDFGNIQVKNDDVNELSRKNFTLSISKDCNLPLKTTIELISSQPAVGNGEGIILDNNAILKIYDDDLKKYLSFNSKNEFVSLDERSIVRNYTAILESANKKTLVEGPFHTSVVVKIDYL